MAPAGAALRGASSALALVSLLNVACLAAQETEPAPTDLDALVDTLVAWHAASRPDRVDSLAGPAIATARAAGDTLHLLRLLVVRGASRAAFGRVLPAEPDLREALALAAAQNDTTRRLQALRWLSVAVSRQGRATEAAGIYRDLESLATSAADSVHLGWAWVGIAYDHYLAGRSDEAADVYGRAARVLQGTRAANGAVWAWNGRGLALKQAGRYREAREAFQQVLNHAEREGDVLNQAMALNHLGQLEMRLGDPGRAIGQLARAADIHRRFRHHREGLLPCIDIAGARVQQGRFAEAAALLDSISTVCRDQGLRDLEVLAISQLADVRLDQGRPAAAAAICREVLATGDLPSRMAATEIRLRLARALAQRDSAAAAASMLARVIREGAGAASLELAATARLGEYLCRAGDPGAAVVALRPAVARARAAASDLALTDLGTQLGRAWRRLAQPDSARLTFARTIEVWERVRARPDDPVWREHRGSAVGDLFAEAAANLLAAPGRDPDLPAAFACVQRYKARTLQERMLGSAAATAPRAPGLDEIRRDVLHDGEVLLDLVEGDEIAVLFCVARDTTLTALLPGRRDMAPRLRLLDNVLISPAVDNTVPVQTLLASVLATWPSEIARRAAAARLVTWCPDGSWHGLPLSLLNARRDPQSPATATALARVPSVAVLARLRSGAGEPDAPASVLAVSGPDPDGPGLLPGAAAETRWLSSRYRNVRRHGEPDTVFDPGRWRGVDVLHLAAHTRLDPWQPWNTTITLSTGGDGALRAADIAQLPLDAGLAVLSGCTTAGSRVVGGEGLIGLAGGFLAARTPAVVASLWPVDDISTALFMTAFYGALARDQTAAAALAAARAACRNDPRSAAPLHWAGFVLIGDGDAQVPVRPRGVRWRLAAVLLLAAAVAGWRSRR